MTEKRAKNGKVDFFEMKPVFSAVTAKMLKTCWFEVGDQRENYGNHGFSTKSFPQFQQLKMWKG